MTHLINPSSKESNPHTPDFLASGGKMAQLVQAMDWSKTPLGPIEQWPQSLKTTVSLCLASNFPISIAWGPHRVQIYNDGYWPICGDKHPTSMGQDFKECWLSAWPVIGEAFEQASLGQTRFLENQRMFLDRYGYLEETFFTFSFSPILDESGGVGGLFHPVTELTQQTLAERRLDFLRTIAEHTANARTVEETLALILETLASFPFDLPFVLLYRLSAEGREATLAGNVGIEAASAAAPATIQLDLSNPVKQPFTAEGAFAAEGSLMQEWPLAEAAWSGQTIQVDELSKVFGPFTCGPYPEPPKTALVFPIYLSGSEQPAYFLVTGVSARRNLDEKYRLFYELLAAAVTNAFTKASAYEQEKQRAEALAELDRAKTTFFSNISHEFRTPLTLMLGPLEDSLADHTHPLPRKQQERLELVQRNTLRLQRLVNSLLDFSRIESGRLQASFEPTDLAAYTGELASVFGSAMEKAGLSFLVDCQPHADPVYVDRDMWEKIVFNLLSNALKFTFQGKVAISLKEEPGKIVLKVSDTGEGIPPAELENLFKRFYRIEGTKSRTHEGSGIGLAFVQELVKFHGGSISAESIVNQGTTFTVILPTGKAHLPQERIVPERTEDHRSGKPNVFINESMQWLSDTPIASSDGLGENGQAHDKDHRKDDSPGSSLATILVVDDNRDMREYVARILKQNPDWKIQSAGDGLLALEAVKQQKPDLILSDVMMPNLDGFGLLKQVKNNPDTASIPVILLSARAGEEATLEGLQKGANDYLIKPFSARELLARVQTQLEITRTRQDNTQLRATYMQLEQREKEAQTLAEELAAANEELRAANEEIQAGNEELGVSNVQLLRTNMDLDNFIYTASHDLKAPILNIEGLIKVLSRRIHKLSGQDEQLEQMLEMMKDSVNRFKETIQDLTDIARIQKQLDGESEPVDLSGIVASTLLDMQQQVEESGARIETQLEACPLIVFPRKNLKSIVYNLLSNAIKYRDPDRKLHIKISCRLAGDYLLLQVEDNGLGMDTREESKIFGMFKRLHNHVEGTGIGLYIVKRMIENAGGKIEVESTVGKGSAFRVYLKHQQNL